MRIPSTGRGSQQHTNEFPKCRSRCLTGVPLNNNTYGSCLPGSCVPERNNPCFSVFIRGYEVMADVAGLIFQGYHDSIGFGRGGGRGIR